MSDQADITPTPVPAPVPEAPSSVLISVEAPPKPKRGKWIALFAVVALLAGGFVAYLALAGDDAEAISLEKAIANSQEARSVAITMTIDLGILGEISADSRVDRDAELMAMTLDMSSVGMPTMEMIVDLGDGSTYISADVFADSGVDIPTKWGKVPGTDALGMGGLGVGSDPADVTSIAEAAEKVDDLGTTEFHGEKVHHFQATIPFAEAMAANPDVADQFDQLGVEMPTELVYDLYVADGNELRGVSFGFDLMGQKLTVEMVFSAYNDIEPIVLPDPSDVTETDLPDM